MYWWSFLIYEYEKEMIEIAISLMASVRYKATGEQTTFAIPFDYLRPAFIYVKIDDEKVESGFEVVDRNVVFTSPPAQDAEVLIYRLTTTKRLVSFIDSSILKAKDLTINQIQNLHLLEENFDNCAGLIPLRISQLEDDVGLVKYVDLATVARTGEYKDLRNIPEFHKVAMSGNYYDLKNLPDLDKLNAIYLKEWSDD